MDDTNFSNTGSGTGFGAQNWGQGQVPPGQPGAVPGQPGAVPGQPGTVQGQPGTEKPESTFTGDTYQVGDRMIDGTFLTQSMVLHAPFKFFKPSEPSLIKPTVDDPQGAQKTINLINNPPQEFIDGIMNNFFTNLSSTDEAAAAEDPDNPPPTTNDPQVIEYAKKTGLPLSTVVRNLLQAQNENFEQSLSKFPPDVADKLRFAHYVPQGATNLSPELRSQLTQLEKQVSQNMANSLGFSDDWTGLPVDASDFTQDLALLSDSAFEALINQKLQDGSLSESDARTLKAMHAGLATGTPTLKNLLAILQGQVTAQLQAKFGFDVAYQPPAETLVYNNVINGDFAQTFMKKVASWMPGNLSDAQKALVQQYAEEFAKNPTSPNIPDNAKKLLTQITDGRAKMLQAFPDMSSLPDDLKAEGEALIAGAKGAIISKYGLDTNWSPTITSLYASGVDPKMIATAQSGIDIAKELVQNATVLVNNMPEGPEKDMYLNYLKVISQALTAMQDAVYAMQSAQSNTSKRMNKAKLDMQLNDIEKQQRAADKAAGSLAKARSLKALGAAFAWIVKIILLIISIWMGPFMMMLAMALFMDQVVASARGSDKTGLDLLMAKITESMPPAAASAVKAIILAAITLLTMNVYMFVFMLTDGTKVVQDCVKTCGGDKMAQEITAMIVNLLVQIALIIAAMIATGGAAAPILAARINGAIANGAKVSVEMAQKIQTIVKLAMLFFSTATTIVTSSIKMDYAIKLSDIDIMKGEADKYSEEVQAIINMLKKLIAKLLALLQGGVENITNINKQQAQKWSESSEVITNIFG